MRKYASLSAKYLRKQSRQITRTHEMWSTTKCSKVSFLSFSLDRTHIGSIIVIWVF